MVGLTGIPGTVQRHIIGNGVLAVNGGGGGRIPGDCNIVESCGSAGNKGRQGAAGVVSGAKADIDHRIAEGTGAKGYRSITERTHFGSVDGTVVDADFVDGTFEFEIIPCPP